MKKDSFLSLISLVAVPMVCMPVLRLYFEKRCGELLEELLLAIFTGCIFAIPNVVVFLYRNNYKVKNELHITLYNIKKSINELQDITKKDIANLESGLQSLYNLHKKLEEILSENFFKKYDKINKTSENLLILLTELRVALNLLKNSTNSTNKQTNTLNNIQQSIVSAKKEIIESIKLFDNDI